MTNDSNSGGHIIKKSIMLEHEEIKDFIRESILETLREMRAEFNQTNKTYLTRKETADILGISLVTLREYTVKGYLQDYKIGNRVLYKHDEVVNAPVGSINLNRAS